MKNLTTTRRESIKVFNKNRILNIIRKQDKISRMDISKILKLRPATVALILDELIKEEFVRKAGFCDSIRGRKANALELNPRARFCIGIYLGDSSILSVLSDLNGNVVNKVDRFGLAKNIDNFLYLEVGEGIAMGMFSRRASSFRICRECR